MTKMPQFLRRALLGGFFLSVVAASPAHAQFSKISEKEEIEAGRQVAKQAIQQYGQPLPASDPRQQRVARLGALFARQSTRKNIPFSYTVLQNDKVLNAFAGPGGPIFVTTKLVSTAANDAELAYVLGHETGHIERKHIVNAAAKQQKLALGAGILGAIIGRGKGGNVVGAISGVAITAIDRGFSRDQERDADDYGVRAMARLGFDPRASISMLGKLGGNSSGLDKYLATHPNPDSRADRERELIQKENLIAVAQKAGGPFLSWKGSSRADADEDIYRYASSNENRSWNSNSYSRGNTGWKNRDEEADIALRVQNSGGYRVVLAPVADVAQYAGGQIESRGDRITASRGDSYVTFTTDSDTAILNGRRVQLSAPAQVLNGRFYAPLGTIATGLDGSASYDQSRNSIRLSFDNGRETYLSP